MLEVKVGEEFTILKLELVKYVYSTKNISLFS